MQSIDQKKGGFLRANAGSEHEAYQAFLTDVNDIFKTEDPEERAEYFLDVWQETVSSLTQKSEGREHKHLPTRAVSDLFERSFSFFSKEVPVSVKKQIAQAQLEFIVNGGNANEELMNNCKGIWGYYVSTEKYFAGQNLLSPQIDKEYLERAHDFRSVMEKMSVAEMDEFAKKKQEGATTKQDLDKIFYLSLARSGSLRYEGRDDESDTIRYFADLYAHDLRVPDELAASAEPRPGEAGGDGSGGGGEGWELGVRMPPHTRFYSFNNDRLPTDETIDAGRVKFFVSADSRVLIDPESGKKRIRQREKDVIVVDMLPLPFLIQYVIKLSAVRHRDDYRSSNREGRAALRRSAVEKFKADLLNFDSGLWKEVGAGLENEPDLVKALRGALSAYHDKSACYLAFSIDINKADQRAAEHGESATL